MTALAEIPHPRHVKAKIARLQATSMPTLIPCVSRAIKSSTLCRACLSLSAASSGKARRPPASASFSARTKPSSLAVQQPSPA